MPIIPNTITQESSPTFKGFVPYQLPNGTVPCDSVSDMFSYDVIPNTTPTNVTYYVGAENGYLQTIRLENLTYNATLKVVVEYDKETFEIPNNAFNMAPKEVVELKIFLNKEGLNKFPGLDNVLKQFSLNVTNLKNGTLVYKDNNPTPLVGVTPNGQPTLLPETIVVT